MINIAIRICNLIHTKVYENQFVENYIHNKKYQNLVD